MAAAPGIGPGLESVPGLTDTLNRYNSAALAMVSSSEPMRAAESQRMHQEIAQAVDDFVGHIAAP